MTQETVISEAEEVQDTESVEETVEAAIPEGIDLDSVAHGEVWLQSFIGKVQEPVVVVFSDITGRKEVIQQNSKVVINPDEDMIGVYFPKEGMAEYSCAVTPPVRQTGNWLSRPAETTNASLLA